MRTLVDIPDRQIQMLADICAAEKKSRAELIRNALAEYLEKRQPTTADFFGMCKGKTFNRNFLKKIREEWD